VEGKGFEFDHLLREAVCCYKKQRDIIDIVHLHSHKAADSSTMGSTFHHGALFWPGSSSWDRWPNFPCKRAWSTGACSTPLKHCQHLPGQQNCTQCAMVNAEILKLFLKVA
jgi:hypothetical protein